MSENPIALAKVIWTNPETKAPNEYTLEEGVTVSLGRSPDNEVYVPERTVSRHHAAISYRAGVFVISDTGSANGVWVNDVRITEPYPLIDGDTFRLFQFPLKFAALNPEDVASDIHQPQTDDVLLERPVLLVTSGPLNGSEFIIEKEIITFGRAINNATWDISLPDHAISRPHARLFMQRGTWYLEDLGSSNGTMLEGAFITEPVLLQDGNTITMGETTLIFQVES